MSNADTMSLEQAWAIINAHHAEEDAKRADESRQFVGRYFRLEGKYTGTDQSFWRCAVVTGVDRSGLPTGRLYRIDVREGTIYDAHQMLGPAFTGWTEISAEEFRKFELELPEEHP